MSRYDTVTKTGQLAALIARPDHASTRAQLCHSHVHASGLVNASVDRARVGGSRFLEVDPVVGGSANDYDYVNGDPINFTDLSGRYPQMAQGNEAEQAWCSRRSRRLLCARAFGYAQTAYLLTQGRFGGVGGQGQADAHQHIVWAALMTVAFGAGTARGFLARHESGESSPMDVANNALGLPIGLWMRQTGWKAGDRHFLSWVDRLSWANIQAGNARTDFSGA